MPHTKRETKTIHTTIGELATAYYEAAVSELKDEAQAARLTQRRVALALRRQHAAG